MFSCSNALKWKENHSHSIQLERLHLCLVWGRALPACKCFFNISLFSLYFTWQKDLCWYFLVSQSCFQTSKDDLLWPEDLSSQQSIPWSQTPQPLLLPVTSVEGLRETPWENRLIYLFQRTRMASLLAVLCKGLIKGWRFFLLWRFDSMFL